MLHLLHLQTNFSASTLSREFLTASQEWSYLRGALAHGVDQLLDDHVHTLDARLLQLYDLLLHNGLKCHIWGKKASSGQKKLTHVYMLACFF